MKKILFVTNDVIGDTSAGPGIRYVELGKALAARGYTVTVMGRKPVFGGPQAFSYAALTPLNLIRHLKQCDMLIIRGGGPLTTLLVMLFGHDKEIIADIYAFTHFEVPHIVTKRWVERFFTEIRNVFHIHKLRLYSKYIDKFWVANERQKNFLLGFFYSEGRFKEEKCISLIPFGYPAAKPVANKKVLRGVVDGIAERDFILIWGGGVWDWLDPITLVKAMDRVRHSAESIKLYFMGVQAPSGYFPAKAAELLDAARASGLLNKTIFVNTGWIPYQDRTDYLLEADAGVSLHPESLETYYSFRTRNLDYVFCGLPMVHTTGDIWAEIIDKKQLGIVVPPLDDHAVAEAVLRLRNDRDLYDKMRRNIEYIYNDFSWTSIAEKAAQSIEVKEMLVKRNFINKSIDLFGSYLLFSIQSLLLFFKSAFK
ncbi:MAG: hypothetical protein A2010_11150 [Nitrospirae bacterium GWD2_57_9]|nr:MAG: hypothetical protein A2010_11150 [Nitrospirae bacterium GWD2_57_9]